ncbi:adenylyl-sulfate kinase [Halotia branconii]|uniref:Adenylyl-sulfate kinase n=1 Tax=Halotia branconii CENA392 TaxID=1539056 RepID=A0AAJ6NQM8_9CYAN|nr:adenylyl-sulfate kinase [Halotia branconii]WGV24802.1 adenylyl-sulfate kinase [Halotia branconii CENA392]
MNYSGFTLWFTGLSGAGKTTISKGVALVLKARGYRVEILDGDVVRTHLCQELGFSKQDRDTNVRRIGFVANLLSRNQVIAIVAAISPYREIREEVRQMSQNFIEVYVKASLETCSQRDVKGLYALAKAGKIKDFTGIDSPYEEPLNPEIICHTQYESIESSITKVIQVLEEWGYICSPADNGQKQSISND